MRQRGHSLVSCSSHKRRERFVLCHLVLNFIRIGVLCHPVLNFIRIGVGCLSVVFMLPFVLLPYSSKFMVTIGN